MVQWENRSICHWYLEGSNIKVSVADQGDGIPPEERETSSNVLFGWIDKDQAPIWDWFGVVTGENDY